MTYLPSDITGHSLQLPASAASGFADGANVTAITSTVGTTTLNSTGTAPKRRAGVLNGHDVLEFLTGLASNSGAGGFIGTDTTKMQSVLTGAAFTISIIAKLGDNGFGTLFNKGGLGDRSCFCHFATNLSTMDAKPGIWSLLKGSTGFNDGNYHLFIFAVNQTANTAKIYVDTVQIASGAIINTDADPAVAVSVGTVGVVGGSLSAKMNFVELDIHAKEFDTTDVNTMAVYTYQTYGVNVGGIVPELTPPTLSSANVASCRANIVWAAATGGTGPYTYRLYRSLYSGTAAQIIAENNLLYAGTNTRYPDMFLAASSTYYYALSVTDAVAAVENTNVVTVNTLAATALKLGFVHDSNLDVLFYADHPGVRFKTTWDAAHPTMPCTLSMVGAAGEKIRQDSRLPHGGGVAGSSFITGDIVTMLAAGVTHCIIQKFTNDIPLYTVPDMVDDGADITAAMNDAGIVVIENYPVYRTTPAAATLCTAISAQTFTTKFRLGDVTSFSQVGANTGLYLEDAVHLSAPGRALVAANMYSTSATGIYNDLTIAAPVLAPPDAVTDLAATLALGVITLGWTAPTHTSSYSISRVVGGVTTVINASYTGGTTFADTGYTGALPTSYIVIAKNAGGDSSPSSAQVGSSGGGSDNGGRVGYGI